MYGYLLRRVSEVMEEHGLKAHLVDEAYTSSTCPIHGSGCVRRVVRGLFKCTRLNKVFNADITAAHNILTRGLQAITPEPRTSGNRSPNPPLGWGGRKYFAKKTPVFRCRD